VKQSRKAEQQSSWAVGDQADRGNFGSRWWPEHQSIDTNEAVCGRGRISIQNSSSSRACGYSTASHRIASHHIASHRITSHRIILLSTLSLLFPDRVTTYCTWAVRIIYLSIHPSIHPPIYPPVSRSRGTYGNV